MKRLLTITTLGLVGAFALIANAHAATQPSYTYNGIEISGPRYVLEWGAQAIHIPFNPVDETVCDVAGVSRLEGATQTPLAFQTFNCQSSSLPCPSLSVTTAPMSSTLVYVEPSAGVKEVRRDYSGFGWAEVCSQFRQGSWQLLKPIVGEPFGGTNPAHPGAWGFTAPVENPSYGEAKQGSLEGEQKVLGYGNQELVKAR